MDSSARKALDLKDHVFVTSDCVLLICGASFRAALLATPYIDLTLMFYARAPQLSHCHP